MDPHLPCTNITLWGSGLADSSGTFTIDGWPPTGTKKQAYSGSWSYDRSKGGTQAIAQIDYVTLVDTAAANGDTPQNKNGYHFKLQFVQDPQKHKTFWVGCSSPPPPTHTVSGTNTSTSTTNNSSTAPTAEVKGLRAHRHRRHLRHAVRAKRLSRRPRHRSGFTG